MRTPLQSKGMAFARVSSAVGNATGLQLRGK